MNWSEASFTDVKYSGGLLECSNWLTINYSEMEVTFQTSCSSGFKMRADEPHKSVLSLCSIYVLADCQAQLPC